jgi:hypothetical protein
MISVSENLHVLISIPFSYPSIGSGDGAPHPNNKIHAFRGYSS